MCQQTKEKHLSLHFVRSVKKHFDQRQKKNISAYISRKARRKILVKDKRKTFSQRQKKNIQSKTKEEDKKRLRSQSNTTEKHLVKDKRETFSRRQEKNI